MSDHMPLYLSEEEAMALLDLCLTSPTEIDSTKERVMLKLSALARRQMSDTEAEARDRQSESKSSTSVETSHAPDGHVSSPSEFDDAVVARVLAFIPGKAQHRTRSPHRDRSPNRLPTTDYSASVADHRWNTRTLLDRLLHRPRRVV